MISAELSEMRMKYLKDFLSATVWRKWSNYV